MLLAMYAAFADWFVCKCVSRGALTAAGIILLCADNFAHTRVCELSHEALTRSNYSITTGLHSWQHEPQCCHGQNDSGLHWRCPSSQPVRVAYSICHCWVHVDLNDTGMHVQWVHAGPCARLNTRCKSSQCLSEGLGFVPVNCFGSDAYQVWRCT